MSYSSWKQLENKIFKNSIYSSAKKYKITSNKFNKRQDQYDESYKTLLSEIKLDETEIMGKICHIHRLEDSELLR